jgi:Protein of unknown function (DUF3604)
MRTVTPILLSLWLAAPLASYAAGDTPIRQDTPANRPYSPHADIDHPTDVFFGDTHVHTALSGDAGGAGTSLMPDAAYRFARGEQVTSNTGLPAKLQRPYDFYMITDHSDGMGMITDLIAGAPNIMADPDGREMHEAFKQGGKVAMKAAQELISQFAQGTLSPALNYQPGNPAYGRVWGELIQAAEDFNNPHHFTTFIAYEWTSLVKGNNLHRNVIFRDGPQRASQVVPYTTTPPLGSRNPRDLWAWLQAYEDKTGGNVTAIAHNGNLSNGMMFALQDDFADGAPYDAAYAEARQKWERLYEVTQLKGDGETHPLLSNEDEFADYENWDWGNLDLSRAKTTAMFAGEYARSGLQRGLQLEATLGVNPFKFGMIGATDTHVGLSTVDDDNFFGKFVIYEPNPNRATHLARRNEQLDIDYKGWRYSSSGMTALWATDNTRGALFDAMERREAYATTGPRMRVRFFGGWDYRREDLGHRNLAQIGYARGVPMGGDLAAPPKGAKAPTFLVFALRDPMGANLDRVQIVKGWLDGEGKPQEKVYDVAWSGDRKPGVNGKLPAVGDTVDLSIPAWTNSIGAAELGTVWTDPDFDAELRAFYYARVIEIPTPRWTAYDRVKFKRELPADIPLKTQERAYTSPIWYRPE